jgi:16S rRNA (cytosine967-C5)-methyltransferase
VAASGAGGTAGVGVAGARSAALAVLVRVEGGAYAAPLLERALHPMPRRDERALCMELVYGCLRWQGELDFALAHLLRRPLGRLPASVRAALRLGAYQILHLDRVPDHAAVSTSVDLVRAEGAGGLSGLVNGVLRQLVRTGPPALPKDPVAALAVSTSHPSWLVAAWRAQYGEAAAARLLAYDNEPPPVNLRVARAVGRQALAARLAAEGIAAEPTALSRDGLRLGHGTSVRAVPGYDEGAFLVQDEAAMLAVEWLGAGEGERVIDACAGRGTKTFGLLDVVGPQGGVIAVDSHGGKLGALAREATRRGQPARALRAGEEPPAAGLATLQMDARALGRAVGPEGAGRILLDAPCTGLGVLRRRPELRWRREAADAEALSALQVALLSAAFDALRPGGEVLYVTCSTDEREDEAVVAAVLRARPGAEAAPVAEPLPQAAGVAAGPLGSVRLFGPATGTDSFFYARLRRRG